MRIKTVIPLFLVILYLFSCQKSDIEEVNDYQFPLALGNQWNYLYKSTFHYTWSDSIKTQIDTLSISVTGVQQDGWYSMQNVLKSSTVQDTTTVSFKNSIEGLEVLPYNNLLGFVTNSANLTPDDTSTLMLPATGEVTSIIQGDELSELATDTVIIGASGTEYLCKHLVIKKGTSTISNLYYNENGIIEKQFTPDTLIVGLDTVIVHKIITLDSYILN